MTRIDRVIVTGASSGIGFDIARAFLEEGAQVILNARDEQKLARARASFAQHAERVFVVAGAIGEPSTASRLAEMARHKLGAVDVLVNNAGIFALKPFLESSAAELDAFYTIGEGADSLASMHPLQRVGEVADTSRTALFLARSGFITGAIVDVDGGYAHGR